MGLSKVTFYRGKQTLGNVALVDGVAVADQPALEKILRTTEVIDPNNREVVTTRDGERYLQALLQNFRPPYFFCRPA